jgi:hypothetical protein
MTAPSVEAGARPKAAHAGLPLRRSTRRNADPPLSARDGGNPIGTVYCPRPRVTIQDRHEADDEERPLQGAGTADDT